MLIIVLTYTFAISYTIYLHCLGGLLDREHRDSYSFIAVARDSGGLSASALIAVNIVDINDNEPKFRPSKYFAKIFGNAGYQYTDISSPIVSIMATDSDEKGINSAVTYEIVAGNENALFSLNSKTGLLYLSQRYVPLRRQMCNVQHNQQYYIILS